MPKEKHTKPPVVYEVFVQSFRDSNNDGIGDLQGLISKLDYIKDLGANAIWITPVHPSPSYHKYDVIDYYGIHPDYGTMKDMDELIAEVHRRDMLLIMDFVINHTSALHPWFIESSSSDANPFRDYYVWRDYATVQDEINKKSTTFDSDNITQWHAEENHKEHYYGFFWKGMPDLNFDNPKVREEIYDIGKFWIEKGVDGFRMDAARHIYPDDRLDDTRKFWTEFTGRMRQLKPEIMIVGEVWSDPKTLASLFVGLPSLFNFELTKAIPELINGGDKNKFIETYSNIQQAYDQAQVSPQDAILLGNHDMNRIRSVLHGDIEKSKLAAAILFTLPGIPYIYYGDEIGMLGKKPDEEIREPFLWGDENFQDTSWIKPIHSTPSTVQTLTQQLDDTDSIYNHYKKWIAFRNDHSQMAIGKLTFLDNINQKDLLGYTITDGDIIFSVFHNVSGSNVKIDTPKSSKMLIGENDIKEETVEMAPYSTVVFQSK